MAAPQNRKKTGGRFRKGQSGNPGGRPKASDDVRDLARQYTEDAVRRLAEWMISDNPKASVAACTALLNRGWGSPPQSVNIEGNITIQAAFENFVSQLGSQRATA